MHGLVTIATGKRYMFTRVRFSKKLPYFKAKKQKKAATLKEFVYILINNGLYHTSSKNKKNLTLLLVKLYLRLKYLNFSSFFKYLSIAQNLSFTYNIFIPDDFQ